MMGVFNIKRRRFELLSEYQSADLTSVVLMKRGRKVVCGSSEGTLYIFNWNGFGATSDRFAIKAESVECIVPVTDSIMCTASTDGYIRWVEQPTAGSTLVLSQHDSYQNVLLMVTLFFLSLEPSTFSQTGSSDALASMSANQSKNLPSHRIPISWLALPMTSS